MVQTSLKGKKSLKRHKKTKRLNSYPIPSRKELDKVEPELWYIIYEEYLLKPKVFRYNFIDEYHAKKFAQEYLEGYKYNILRGDRLISFGMVDSEYRLSELTPNKKGFEYRYMFSPGLPSQRRKSLRTAYRRSYRRRQKKLLEINKKMNRVPVTLTKIHDKPAVFFKKLKKYYPEETAYAFIFPAWYINEEGWRIDEIKKYARDKPNLVNEVVSIVRTLEDFYNEMAYDYKNDTYVSAAIALHKKYRERIHKYMAKKLKTKLTDVVDPIMAWRELIARGFVDISLLTKNMEPGYFYVKSTIANLIYSLPHKSEKEAESLRQTMGLCQLTTIIEIP